MTHLTLAALLVAGTGDVADVTYVFERDRNGQVIAFYAGNGRARDVRFARMK